jgi:HEAT repeat protein
MSLLAHALLAFTCVALQEGRADPSAGNSAPQSDDLEALVYASVRLETETRDFTAALESWSKAEAAATKAGRKELVVKSQLGRARCLKALGKNEKVKAILKQIVGTDPNNAEARALLAKLDAPDQKDDELEGIVRNLLDVALNLTKEHLDDRINSARDDLIRMSDVAVPQIAELLRDNRVGVVDGAATILARMQSSRGFEALAEALSDPRCRYPGVLVAPVRNAACPVAHAFFLAMAARPEPEMRREGIALLLVNIDDQPDAVKAATARRLLADVDPAIRRQAAGCSWSASVAKLLLPDYQALADSKEVDSIELAIDFLDRHREVLPADVVATWSAQFARSPLPAVRRAFLEKEFNAATSIPGSGGARWRTLTLLKFLGDDDPSVFSAGASKFEYQGASVGAEHATSSREAILAALRHAVTLKDVSLAKRSIVLTRLPINGLADDELFELFARLGELPADADAGWRASIRQSFCSTLLARHRGEYVFGADAAKRLLQIPDAAGRRQWFEAYCQSDFPIALAALEAVKVDDVALRVLGYRGLSSGHVAGDLPHVAEDLQSSDPAVVLAAVKAIGSGERPGLVAPLRKLVASDDRELHVAALRALASVGGKEVADELLVVMKATSKDGGEFPYLRQLEHAFGAERLANELVAVARLHGTSNQICWWMREGSDLCVSEECVADFVRQLPPELVSINILDLLASHLPPAVLAMVVRVGLRSGNGIEVELAARLAGGYHIEAAWPDLVALLDTGVGQAREEAIAALKSLRDYRELRRTFAADDSDARRDAFEKAKTMTKSSVAEQRAGAAIALAATGDVAAIPPLLDLLGDGDESVRSAARKALEKLADRAAAPPVESPKGGDTKGADGDKGKKKQQ